MKPQPRKFIVKKTPAQLEQQRKYLLLKNRDLVLTEKQVATLVTADSWTPSQLLALLITDHQLHSVCGTITNPQLFLLLAHKITRSIRATQPEHGLASTPEPTALRTMSRWFRFTLQNLQDYEHLVDWSDLSQNPYLDDDTLLHYRDRLEWHSTVLARPLSTRVLHAVRDRLDWFDVSRVQAMPLDFIHEMENFVDWRMISKHQVLTEEFIAAHAHLVHWPNISEYQALSEQFIHENSSRVSWSEIIRHQGLSEQFIRDNVHHEYGTEIAKVVFTPFSKVQQYCWSYYVGGAWSGILVMVPGQRPTPMITWTNLKPTLGPEPDPIPEHDVPTELAVHQLLVGAEDVYTLKNMRVPDFDQLVKLLDTTMGGLTSRDYQL